MAVSKIVNETSLSIEVQKSVDQAGDSVFSKKTFSNVRNDVDAQNAYDVAEANSLMDIIIAKNVFVVESGALVGKDSAKLTERKVTKYEVA